MEMAAVEWVIIPFVKNLKMFADFVTQSPSPLRAWMLLCCN